MKSITANWFICKIAYDKTQEDGAVKSVTEQYVINADTFSACEKRILEELGSFISTEITVKDLSIARFREIFFDDENGGDNWYNATVQFITIDERTEREKRIGVEYLVQGNSLEGARKNIDKIMGSTLIDYSIAAIKETRILDVFKHGL